jgi:hypothetical protein
VIICESEFTNPYHEVDVYARIPVPNDRPDHRLSVRKNEKGQFEAFRHFHPSFLNGHKPVEEVIITSIRLSDIIEITNMEAAKYHGSEAAHDQVCNHHDVISRHCRKEKT